VWTWLVLFWASTNPKTGFNNPALFGGAFGPFSGFASALALGAAVWAIKLQREELALQRNELKLSREEFQGQKRALLDQVEGQRAALAQQKRDHFLARDAHRASLLQMKLDIIGHPQLEHGRSNDILRGRMPENDDGTPAYSEDRKMILTGLVQSVSTLRELEQRVILEPLWYLSAKVTDQALGVLPKPEKPRKRYRVHNLSRTGRDAQIGEHHWDEDGFSESFDTFKEAVSFAQDERAQMRGGDLAVIQDDGLVVWESRFA
jgi:hypothetical protein